MKGKHRATIKAIIESNGRSLRTRPAGNINMTMEEMKKILLPEDYFDVLATMSEEDIDRQIKQWDEFARQERPVFNVSRGTNVHPAEISPHKIEKIPVVPVRSSKPAPRWH
jgi:hypothetical protein